MSDKHGIRARFRCSYPGFELDVNLQLPGQGVTALFGHSGCGKTTLLRCMAGLQTADGVMSVNGDSWQDEKNCVPVHRRPLAYVFQEASLFPHLSVRKNLLYGYRRTPEQQRKIHPEQVEQWLGLSHLMNRMPDRLSGGERQRVAIARALLTSPGVLLMDEPLSALDQNSKQDIMPYLETLRDSLSMPILYVSHSAAEVARLADYIVMMDNGRVTAEGPLQETLARTDQPFGLEDDAGVIINTTIGVIEEQWHLARGDFDSGHLWIRSNGNLTKGQSVRVQVLARDISIALNPHPDQSIQNLIPARIDQIADDISPGIALTRLVAGTTPFVARLTTRSVETLALKEGQQVWMQVKSVAIVD